MGFLAIVILLSLSSVFAAANEEIIDNEFCMHFRTENDVIISEGTCLEPEITEGICTFCGETIKKHGFYGDHNYALESVQNYVVKMKCELCDATQTGSIPETVTLYSVSSYGNNGISYTSLDSIFDENDTKYIYISSDWYFDFDEIDFIVSDESMLTIEEAFDIYENCYSFSFLKEGSVDVTVVSKYDNSIEFGTYTFKSLEKARSGDINTVTATLLLQMQDLFFVLLQISVNAAMSRCSMLIQMETVKFRHLMQELLRVAAHLEDNSILAKFVLQNNDNSWYYYENTHELSLNTGDSCKLDYFFIRGNSDDITWKSSNPAAVTVDNTGKITAKDKGFSCIIVSNGDETFYYEVKVKNELQQKIDKLRDKYPDGYYWNNHTPSKKYLNVTETPCDDHESGKYAYCKGQCAGFAALLFNEIYGYGNVSYGVTWDNVKIGDYLRLKKHHSVFVIDVINKGDIVGYDYYNDENITADEKYIVVAHCNWGWTCNIVWDEIFTPSYEIDSSLSYTKK